MSSRIAEAMRSKASISARNAKGRGTKNTAAYVWAAVGVCLTVAIGVGLFFALRPKRNVEGFEGLDAEIARTIKYLKNKPANEWGPCPHSDMQKCVNQLIDAKTDEIFLKYMYSVKKYKSGRESNDTVKKNIRVRLSESLYAAAAEEQARRKALPKKTNVPPPAPLPLSNKK
jgi:hypothetical protein